ncbi:hypothetical protein KEM54_005227 [Ascosphaera aggregata]|nr:hypothetical protein KEM54_005227 [Ascosphaera aggregata]
MASSQLSDHDRRLSGIPSIISRVASPVVRGGEVGSNATPGLGVSRAVTPYTSKDVTDEATSLNAVTAEDLDKETEQSPVPFPPPQVFDILPQLHDLLARLITPTASSQTPVPNLGLTGGEPLLSGPGNPVAAVGGAGSTVGSATGGLSIDPKALQIESAAIRRRLQRAQAAVEGLPDMHRSVDEQESEIEAVERRIARLKEVLADFGTRSSTVLEEMSR